MDAAIQGDCADELQDVHPSFYEALVQRGFIVDATEDETQKAINIMQEMNNESSEFKLIINPTMNCNFKCWYCYEMHIKDSKMGPETITAVCNFTDNLLRENEDLKVFTLSFFGGEPLLYFHKVVVPILQYIKEKVANLDIRFNSGFTTNGYLLNQEMIDIFKLYGVNSLQITLDGNRELHNTIRFVSATRGSYDEIVANIKLACRNGIYVTTRINYTPKTLAGIKDIMADFSELTTEERRFMNFSFHQVWQDEKSADTDDMAAEVRKSFTLEEFTVSVPNEQALHTSCYADKTNEAVINYNGEVFKCTARDFTSEKSEGRITANGKIEWNELNKRRQEKRFSNKPCLECKIFPLCAGGCSQLAHENYGKDYCVHNFDEDRKRELVKQRFLDTMALVPDEPETSPISEPAIID
jgi:uncharacterized protein